MKSIEQILRPSRLVLAIAIAFGAAAYAQDKTVQVSSSSNDEHDATVHQRIWVGVYGSGSPFRMFSGHSTTDSLGNQYTSKPANGIAGGGVNVNLRVFNDFWLNVGAVYHYGGYDTTTFVNDAVSTTYAQRTRVHLYDFPLMVRYAGPKWHWSKYSFYELGGALRYASSVSNSYSAGDLSGNYCCAPSSTDSFKKMIGGVAVGTGLVAKDDFGIKVAPEVRYIRWMGDTLHSSSVGTSRDQLEVGISFGF